MNVNVVSKSNHNREASRHGTVNVESIYLSTPVQPTTAGGGGDAGRGELEKYFVPLKTSTILTVIKQV